MKKIKISTVIKSMLIIVLWITYFIINKFLPIISNSIALGQLSNSNEDYVLWQLYQSIAPLMPLILTLLTILMFYKEIISTSQNYNKPKER